MVKKLFILTMFCFLLYGCGVTKNTPITPYQFDNNFKIDFSLSKGATAEIPDEVLDMIKNHIKEGLTERNLLSSKTDNEGRKAEVVITSYRMRPDVARLTVGIMAGCDNIRSNVTIYESEEKQKIGESEITINECAAWGVSSQVINKFSEGVVKYLAGK